MLELSVSLGSGNLFLERQAGCRAKEISLSNHSGPESTPLCPLFEGASSPFKARCSVMHAHGLPFPCRIINSAYDPNLPATYEFLI